MVGRFGIDNTNALSDSDYATIVATYNSHFLPGLMRVHSKMCCRHFWWASHAAAADYNDGGYYSHPWVGNTVTYDFDRWNVSCTGTIGTSFSSINHLRIADKLTGNVWDIQGTLNYSGLPWLYDLTSGSITEASVRVPLGADLNSYTQVIGNNLFRWFFFWRNYRDRYRYIQ